MKRSTRMLFAMAGVVVQFGLAVLGWGDFGGFFSHGAFVALAAATLAMAVVAGFSEGNISPGEREDRGNRWVLAAFTVITVALVVLPPFADHRNILVLDGEAIRWVGTTLYAVGGALRLWPVFVLGRRFSGLVAIQPGHTLVTTGIYGSVRNPSYLGFLVAMLGWALAFRTVVGLVLAALLVPPLVARMRSEERLLHAHFGAEYDAYVQRTWRLIPGLY